MIVIPCPHCGPRNHDEFVYAGDAAVTRSAPDAPLAAWTDTIYLRDNPRGAHRELWRHNSGCGAYLVVERDTLTHAVLSAVLAGEGAGNGR